MTDRSIAVILPYFGKLPPYLATWARSCEANPDFHWKLITDDADIPCDLPPNVTIVESSLDEVREVARRRLEIEPAIPNAYKLVDFKPCFGHMFPELIAGHTHWANSDLDMNYGTMSAFIDSDALDKHLRLYHRGHLSIFQASEAGVNAFRMTSPGCDWRTVCTDEKVHGYDEWYGLSRAMEANGHPVFHEEVIADIERGAGRLRRTREPNADRQVFYWERGKVYQEMDLGERIERKEWAYIHFQKRPMAPPSFDPFAVESWYVTPNGFEPRKIGDDDPDRFERYNPHSHVAQAKWVLGKAANKVRKMISR